MTATPADSKAKNPFGRFLDCELTLTGRREFIDKCCEGLGISTSTFYRRLRNPKEFTDADRLYISQLAGKSVAEIFEI